MLMGFIRNEPANYRKIELVCLSTRFSGGDRVENKLHFGYFLYFMCLKCLETMQSNNKIGVKAIYWTGDQLSIPRHLSMRC